MSGLTLDAGALIAFERSDRRLVVLLSRAIEQRMAIVIPAAVVGQVWRDGRKQARLARLLSAHQVTVESLDDEGARAAGQLCGVSRTSDVIDATVVLSAKSRGDAIVTSDASDMRRLDSKIKLISV